MAAILQRKNLRMFRLNKFYETKEILRVLKYEDDIMKKMFFIKNSEAAMTEHRVTFKWPFSVCKSSDFKNHGVVANCIHIMVLLSSVLEINNVDVLTKAKLLPRTEFDLAISKPTQVPSELLLKQKNKKKFYEYQSILIRHSAYGKVMRTEFQAKTKASAACKTCKTKINIGDLCIRVYDAVCIPYGYEGDQPTLRDVTFCLRKKCVERPLPYCHVIFTYPISDERTLTTDQKSQKHEQFGTF